MLILLKVVVRLIVSLSSANLICRSTDISKCFIESLGVRYNESRLYVQLFFLTYHIVRYSHKEGHAPHVPHAQKDRKVYRRVT